MRWALATVLAVPLLELVVAIEVGRAIGAGWTILLLLAFSLLGGATVRRAGARSLSRLDATLQEGRVPGPDLADTAILLVAGLLLAFPGFVTGLAGLLLMLPPVRRLARGPLERRLARAAADRVALFSAFGPGAGGPVFGTPGPVEPGGMGGGPGRRGGAVVTGEVIGEPDDGHDETGREPGPGGSRPV